MIWKYHLKRLKTILKEGEALLTFLNYVHYLAVCIVEKSLNFTLFLVLIWYLYLLINSYSHAIYKNNNKFHSNIVLKKSEEWIKKYFNFMCIWKKDKLEIDKKNCIILIKTLKTKYLQNTRHKIFCFSGGNIIKFVCTHCRLRLKKNGIELFKFFSNVICE